jgi:hypothetical protein
MEVPVCAREVIDADRWSAAIVTGARLIRRGCGKWRFCGIYLAGGDECRSNGSLSALEKVNNGLKPVACSSNTFLSEVAESGYSRATFTCNKTVTSLRVDKTWRICACMWIMSISILFLDTGRSQSQTEKKVKSFK